MYKTDGSSAKNGKEGERIYAERNGGKVLLNTGVTDVITGRNENVSVKTIKNGKRKSFDYIKTNLSSFPGNRTFDEKFNKIAKQFCQDEKQIELFCCFLSKKLIYLHNNNRSIKFFLQKVFERNKDVDKYTIQIQDQNYQEHDFQFKELLELLLKKVDEFGFTETPRKSKNSCFLSVKIKNKWYRTNWRFIFTLNNGKSALIRQLTNSPILGKNNNSCFVLKIQENNWRKTYDRNSDLWRLLTEPN